MMQPTGDCRQIPQPRCYMLGTLLKDPSALVLGEIPPRRGLANGDESGTSCMRATECRLPCEELVLLGSSYIALIAREPSQHPFCTVRHLCDGPRDDVQPANFGKGVSGDGADVHDSPCTAHAPYEREESGIHFDGYPFCGPNDQAQPQPLSLSSKCKSDNRISCQRPKRQGQRLLAAAPC